MSTSTEGINVAVLRGSLSSDPRELELESGSLLLRLEVTTRTDAGADTVPVAWFDPPRSAPQLAAGDEVVVVGRVRRRYWAGGGGPQSSTEVLASTVAPARRASARTAIATAAAALET
jgi:single-strand DNA-binding protein